MRSTRPPAHTAALVDHTPAADSDGGDPVISAALRRAEQQRDRGDLAAAYGWAAYAHQLCQHRGPDPEPGLRLRVAQVLAPLAFRVGDTALAAVHDDLATLTTTADHKRCLRSRTALAVAGHANAATCR